MKISIFFFSILIITMFQNVKIFPQNNNAYNFDSDSAYKYLKSQTDMGVRNYGSEGHTKVQEFIKSEIKKMDYDVNTHKFKAPYIPRRNGENIYAFLKGRSDKYIVITSHYDTRSVAEKDPSFIKRKEPIIGANDGGSSTAVLLELMRTLKQKEGKLPYSVAFVFFDLEDDGGIYNKDTYDYSDPLRTDWIQGSIKFVEDDIIPKNKIYFGILLDLVGAKDAIFKYESYSYQKFNGLYNYIWQAAKSLGYNKYFEASHWGAIVDDHYPFVYRDIPFIDIIGMGYKYHHTHEDTIDKIDKKTLEVVGNLVEHIVENPPNIKNIIK